MQPVPARAASARLAPARRVPRRRGPAPSTASNCPMGPPQATPWGMLDVHGSSLRLRAGESEPSEVPKTRSPRHLRRHRPGIYGGIEYGPTSYSAAGRPPAGSASSAATAATATCTRTRWTRARAGSSGASTSACTSARPRWACASARLRSPTRSPASSTSRSRPAGRSLSPAARLHRPGQDVRVQARLGSLRPARRPPRPDPAAGPARGLVPLALALTVASRRPIALEQVARLLDERLDLFDQLATAHELERRAPRTTERSGPSPRARRPCCAPTAPATRWLLHYELQARYQRGRAPAPGPGATERWPHHLPICLAFGRTVGGGVSSFPRLNSIL